MFDFSTVTLSKLLTNKPGIHTELEIKIVDWSDILTYVHHNKL